MKEIAITMTAILSVAGLSAFAISQGEDGAIFMTAVTIIGGLAGYQIGKRRKPQR